MAVGATLALFVVGVAVGAAAVVVLTLARRTSVEARVAADRLTAAWSLAELGSPLLLARDLDIELPSGTRAVVSGRASLAVLRAGQVRRAADLAVEVAVAADGRRALLFPGGLRPGALALVVADPALVARLASLAAAAWAAGVPYVERRALADLAGEPGLPIEAEGRVVQVLPRPASSGVLLRLEDGGHSVAVHAARDDGFTGRRVRVQGRLGRDAGGYPIVEADAVTALD
ncbi:MAG: hypothetical protein WC876_02070 [Candidatus Thermoplasmatota archaeon]|jgi:hypothetical protein